MMRYLLAIATTLSVCTAAKSNEFDIMEQLKAECAQPSAEMHDMYKKYCVGTVSEEDARDFLTPNLSIYKGDKMITANKVHSSNESTIVTIGKTTWKLIDDNDLVVDYEDDWAGAVKPEYEDSLDSLEGWEGQKSDEYKFEWKVGLSVVSELKFKFIWDSEGHNAEGLGKYIVDAGVKVTHSYARKGQWTFAHVEVRNPVNYGSSNDPIAGLDVQVFFESKSNFADSTVSCTMTVRGDSDSHMGVCEQND